MAELCCEHLSLQCNWLYVIIMSRTKFREHLHSIVCLKIKKPLAQSRCHIWSPSHSNVIWIKNHLVRKRTLNYLCKLDSLAIWLSVRSPGVLVKIKNIHFKYWFSENVGKTIIGSPLLKIMVLPNLNFKNSFCGINRECFSILEFFTFFLHGLYNCCLEQQM